LRWALAPPPESLAGAFPLRGPRLPSARHCRWLAKQSLPAVGHVAADGFFLEAGAAI